MVCLGLTRVFVANGFAVAKVGSAPKLTVALELAVAVLKGLGFVAKGFI
jgi:hypothetical protein